MAGFAAGLFGVLITLSVAAPASAVDTQIGVSICGQNSPAASISITEPTSDSVVNQAIVELKSTGATVVDPGPTGALFVFGPDADRLQLPVAFDLENDRSSRLTTIYRLAGAFAKHRRAEEKWEKPLHGESLHSGSSTLS